MRYRCIESSNHTPNCNLLSYPAQLWAHLPVRVQHMPTVNVVHVSLPNSKRCNLSVDNADAFSVQVGPIIHPCSVHKAPRQQTHQHYVGVGV